MNGTAMTMHPMTNRPAARRAGSRVRARSGNTAGGLCFSKLLGSLHDLVELRARERYEARRQPL